MHTATDTPNRQARRAAASKRRAAANAFAYCVADACSMGGFGRTTLYGLFAAGRVRKLKVGKKSLACGTSLRNYLAELGAEIDLAA